MQENGELAVFLNLYDGVNISYSGKVVEVGEQSVTFNVDIMQILAMRQEKNAYIVENAYLKKHLKADISDINIALENVTLTNFTYIDHMNANLRTCPRVHPSKSTRIRLSGQDSVIEGNIYDISKGGLSVLSSEKADFDTEEPLKAVFKIELEDGTKTDITLDVRLVVRISYNGFLRYCLQLCGENNTKEFDDFIDKRIGETIEELKKQVNLYR